MTINKYTAHEFFNKKFIYIKDKRARIRARILLFLKEHQNRYY